MPFGTIICRNLVLAFQQCLLWEVSLYFAKVFYLIMFVLVKWTIGKWYLLMKYANIVIKQIAKWEPYYCGDTRPNKSHNEKVQICQFCAFKLSEMKSLTVQMIIDRGYILKLLCSESILSWVFVITRCSIYMHFNACATDVPADLDLHCWPMLWRRIYGGKG
jgi:hypothetical protein